MAKTITQLPPATTVTATTVLPADNAAATATEKVTVAQIVGLAPVQAVAGRTGNVALAVADISGLQTALDGKQPAGSYLTAVPDGSVTDAKVAAPGLSGAAINWVAIVEWQPNTSYAKGALVSFQGVAYRRSSAGMSGPTFATSDWQQVTPSEFPASRITSGTLDVERIPSLPASLIGSGTVAAARLGSGTANSATFLRGDGAWSEVSTVYDFTRTTKPSDASGSTPGPYTWTIPATARRIKIITVSGGGGGGSGRRGADATLCGGGGGGGSGDVKWTEVFVSELASTTLHISIAPGGAGAAAVTTDNTNGLQGGTSGSGTAVRYDNASGDGLLQHDSWGWLGSGGTSTAGGGGGNSAWDHFAPGQHVPGGAGGNGTTAAGNSGASTNFGSGSPTGGGGGGGLSAGNATQSGGWSAAPYRAAGAGRMALGGIAGQEGANGGTGFAAFFGMVGGGGGGGGSSTTANGGNGGNGGFPGGGGGGGGASRNGFNSGAGGNGAAGMARIIVYY
jgi:hypothetical protein